MNKKEYNKIMNERYKIYKYRTLAEMLKGFIEKTFRDNNK